MNKQDPMFCCILEAHLSDKDSHYLRVKGWKTIFQAKGPKNQMEWPFSSQIKLIFTHKLSKKIRRDTSYWSKEQPTKMNSQF